VDRCGWPGDDPQMVAYHDDEWGRPVTDEQALFEALCLSGAQAGLSWSTILRKREGYRQAFDGFDIEAVAAYGEDDVERLLNDPGIVRNRAKVRSAIANARAVLAMHERGETLSEVVWSVRPEGRARPVAPDDVPAVTPEAEALSKALKARGFSFVGPTIAYAFMQAVGVVDDHLAACPFGAPTGGASARGG
jgi:DNA-3-methyladenine glycosylase I